MVARGTESTAMLAAGDADLSIGPASELINQPGVETIGQLPESLQLWQVFVAAVVKDAPHAEEAQRLVEFLSSERAATALKNAAMLPPGEHVQK